MNHAKYTLLQDNQLFLAPLRPDPQQILDIGTGTGTRPTMELEAYSYSRHLRDRDCREVPVSHNYRNRHSSHTAYMVRLSYEAFASSHLKGASELLFRARRRRGRLAIQAQLIRLHPRQRSLPFDS
jgi:hypothetical protein